jgi:thioredoxin reductase (NADPH)
VAEEPIRDLLVVGAGPAGLAAAIAAREAGLEYEVVEKGALVNSIFHFPRNQVFFTTPELLEIGGLPFVTPYEKPTRIEALRYYRRVVETFSLRVRLGEEVTAIRSEGPSEASVFAVETRRAPRDIQVALPSAAAAAGARSARAAEPPASREERARNVILACGYYDHPNRLDVPGEDLPHVSHYYAEAHAFYRQRVVVVGGKNSAALAALDLLRHGAAVTLVHRRDRLSDSIKYWIRPDIENRIREGAVAARFGTRVVEIQKTCVVLESPAGREEVAADAVFLLTGYHPDAGMLTRAGVRVDPQTFKPEHDHATFETSVRGLFVAGSMVSGRETNKIFIENGRFHGQAIVSAILARRAGR